jgi:hypothetical protein
VRGDGAVAQTTVTVSSAASLAPVCSVKASSATLAKQARTFGVSFTWDIGASIRLTAVAVLARSGSHKKVRVAFGTASGRDVAGHVLRLTLKPTRRALAKVRSASAGKGKVSLAFSLVAANRAAQGRATARLAKLHVAN